MEELNVSITQVKKLIEKAEAVNAKDVTFSFIIGSLFPDAYYKIQDMLVKERIAGYNEAMAEFKRVQDNDN